MRSPVGYLALTVCLIVYIYRPVTCTNYAACGDDPFSLAILLDSSVSIPGANMVYQPLLTWKTLITFTESIISSLPTASNLSVAVIRFSSSSVVAVPLTPLRPGFSLSALDSLLYVGGNTDIAAALALAQSELTKTSPGIRKVALVLTDGLSNINGNQTAIQAVSLQTNVEVFAIGLSDYIDDVTMAQIASPPKSKNLLQVSNMNQLLALKDLIVSRMCNLPDPTVPPPTSCKYITGCSTCQDPNVCDICTNGHYKSGSTCADCLPFCSVCKDGNSCDTCATGYYRRKTTGLCTLCLYKADLAFLVDTSGSIRDKNPPDHSYDNFNIILNFITNILDRLPLGFNDTRVAEVTFSTTAQAYFELNTFYNASRAQLYTAIRASPYQGSYTNTSGALRLLRTDVFTLQNGDRPEVPNVCIIITDGLSNIDSNETIPEAVLDRASGVTIYSIGVTNQFNTVELKGMASSDADVFVAPDYISLTTSIYDALGNTLCGG